MTTSNKHKSASLRTRVAIVGAAVFVVLVAIFANRIVAQADDQTTPLTSVSSELQTEPNETATLAEAELTATATPEPEVTANETAGSSVERTTNTLSETNSAPEATATSNSSTSTEHASTENNTSELKEDKQEDKQNEKKEYRAYARTIPNGIYNIVTKLHGSRVLDVDNASSTNGANIQLWDANGTNAQKFLVTWNEQEGGYTITNVGSKLALASDASAARKGNISQAAPNNKAEQRWYIVNEGSGYYSIRSTVSACVIDIDNARTNNGTNVQLFDANGTNAQRFVFVAAAYSESSECPEDQGIANGVYEIASVFDTSKVLDIDNAGMQSGVNVQLFTRNNTSAQRFIIAKNGDGTYRITSLVSGMVLGVDAGPYARVNISQRYNADSNLQKWRIYTWGNGTYSICSAANTHFTLDISGGVFQNRTNIWTYDFNRTPAQKFSLNKVSYTPLTGEYSFASAKNRSMVLSIKYDSRKMGADLQVAENDWTLGQKFIIESSGDGYVTIRNAKSGHLLDATWGYRWDRANIWQYGENGTLAQKWIVHPNSNGSYSFINAHSSRAMDVAGGTAVEGMKVQQYTYNGSAAQQYYLTATSGVDSSARDYSSDTNTAELQADEVLSRIGYDLYAAYKYACIPYRTDSLDAHLGVQHFALKGMQNRRGNCYVMASTFCLLARRLGYDARQWTGTVTLARGVQGPHSWVEINGLVYDPDFEVEVLRNGFGFYYGAPGTLRYTGHYVMDPL